MRLKYVPGSPEHIAESEFVIKKPEEHKGSWNTLFGNSNPIHIEIGMGKGRFITELARKNPNINYIGVEKYTSVLIRAIEKREIIEFGRKLKNLTNEAPEEEAQQENTQENGLTEKEGTIGEEKSPCGYRLPNLYYLCVDAEFIDGMFAKGEVDRIYLNFSDPWPKDRHAKRRLTSAHFLSKYETFLNPEGCIAFKTDNRGLFDFSLTEIAENGWELSEVTYDLHNSEYAEGNVMTEYEQKFSAKGNPINRLVARKKF